MGNNYDPVGCAPYLQGYLARSYGQDREPPTWHETHHIPLWRSEWFRGYDARIKWESTDYGSRKVAKESAAMLGLGLSGVKNESTN